MMSLSRPPQVVWRYRHGSCAIIASCAKCNMLQQPAQGPSSCQSNSCAHIVTSPLGQCPAVGSITAAKPHLAAQFCGSEGAPLRGPSAPTYTPVTETPSTALGRDDACHMPRTRGSIKESHNHTPVRARVHSGTQLQEERTREEAPS